jgi:DNA-binding protein YbaB
MSDAKQDGKKVSERMKTYFDALAEQAVTASSEGIVTLKMTRRLHVESVRLESKMDAEERAKVEGAIAAAVNHAIEKVLKSNVAQLAAAVKHPPDKK